MRDFLIRNKEKTKKLIKGVSAVFGLKKNLPGLKAARRLAEWTLRSQP